MLLNELYPSKYLKAADLNGTARKVKIERVTVEILNGENERKPVASFQGVNKALVLNRTNASIIGTAFGEDTDAWSGCVIELFPDKTLFQGRMVDCIRVRIPLRSQAQSAHQKPAAQPPADAGAELSDIQDDVPW
jgi:hypothetical protein